MKKNEEKSLSIEMAGPPLERGINLISLSVTSIPLLYGTT
jgi:hypothetical protein